MNVQQVNKKSSEPLAKRDADLSRAQILEAATSLFAKQGFDNTSVQQIAKAAGVARGTPHYFFESKAGLFSACFERENEKALQVIPAALMQVGDNASPKDLVNSLIDIYLDFLEANPNFFRLLQWASLEDTRLVHAVSAHWQMILDVFDLSHNLARHSDFSQEISQLVYSLIGICTVHYSFGDCLARPMGVALDSDFLAERKKHIKKLIFKLIEV